MTLVVESGKPFTAEATAATGMVGTIAVQIVDADGNAVIARHTTDIAEAPARSYTADLTAPEPLGRYRIIWDTGGDRPGSAEDLVVAANPYVLIDAVAYQPTVAEVAALLRARTKDINGNELGTFTDDTRPTGGEAVTLINQAAGKVAARVGSHVPSALSPSAAEVVALRAAMLIELSYWPDQITVSRSPYTELKALYEEAYDQLLTNITDIGADGLPGTEDDVAAGRPSYSFPTTTTHVPGAESPLPATWTGRDCW